MPNGLSSELFELAMGLARAHSPFSDPRACVIGFVGSLSRWNRVDRLFKALRDLGAPQDSRWQVKIVGFGKEYHRLLALAREYALERGLAWLEALSYNQAFGEIAEFDIAILPHTLSTGAPLKLFEYAALARPTTTRDLPNLGALFSEEEMYFVEPENPQVVAKAVKYLANDPKRARRMGLTAQDWVVSECTWRKNPRPRFKGSF
jgi:glycosyltransferase involved in cell wall biosynthesis